MIALKSFTMSLLWNHPTDLHGTVIALFITASASSGKDSPNISTLLCSCTTSTAYAFIKKSLLKKGRPTQIYLLTADSAYDGRIVSTHVMTTYVHHVYMTMMKYVIGMIDGLTDD